MAQTLLVNDQKDINNDIIVTIIVTGLLFNQWAI